MRILDATASTRSIWYQKNHPFITFMDRRHGKYYSQTGNCKTDNVRVCNIFPNIIARWQNTPFKNNSFDMVVFDPPHLFTEQNKKHPAMATPYGIFYKENWKKDLADGIIELFRVLKPNGIFILKWCEVDKSVDEIINLIPYNPLFGTRTGQSNNTHWICFIKHRFEKTFEELFLVEDAYVSIANDKSCSPK